MEKHFSPEFHAIIEKQVADLEYGQMTINVQLKDSKPILPTLNIVKSKRKKYVQKLDNYKRS